MLHPQHEQEWLDSCVDPGIIELNVKSLSLTTPYEYLLYGLSDSERRNDGRLRDYWLKKYQHVESGGWWCSGVDVLTLDDSLWGTFKPNCPRTEEKPLGFGKSPKLKTIKYEHPPKVGTEILALKVSDLIWRRIADQCGVYPYCPLPSASSKSVTNSENQFWAWLIDNPGIALTITEGSKKAGALLTAGYAALALPGIFNGYRQERDEFGNKIGFPSLIPQLEVFATKGREINFCFDRDSNPKASENVKKAIASGQKAILHTSAQKSQACWSSRTLESYFTQKFPSLRILRIDSESIREPNHPAFGCMGNLNAILPQYDLVIASPTIETGVSIDVPHFDSVWCLALGVTTVSGVCQTLERVRHDVPRHLFAKKRSNQRIANGETDIRKILRTQHQLTRVNIALLGGADSIAALDDTTPEHLRTWGKIACINNEGWRRYRESILSKLKSEGYEITEVSERSEKATEIKSSVIETKEANYLHERIGISNSQNLTDTELCELEKKTCRTKEERYSLRKGKLRKRYATDSIDPELILKDDSGWYPQIQLHYYMTLGHIYLSDRDRRVANKMKETGGGKIFKPDFNSRMLSSEVECLRLLEIEQFLDSERSFTDKNLKEWYEKISSPITRSQIKAILGVSINPNHDSPIAVAQRLLKKLGLKLTNLGRPGSRGDRQRVYKMINLDPDGRQAIFERWFARDEKTYLDDTVSTISINVS